MKTLTLTIEDNAVDKVMWFLEHLKDVVKIEPRQEDDMRIDEQHCLKVLEKINRKDYSGFTPIEDIDGHIAELKNAIG